MQAPRLGAIFLLLLVALDVQGYAQSLTFPLEGFYHPGRAMPVQWDQFAPGGAIQLAAKGAITSRVESIGQSHGVFPWLVIEDQIASPSIAGLGSLRPLDDGQLLILNTLADEKVPDELYPPRLSTIIRLDASVLAASPFAWQTVDAIVTDGPNLARVPPENIEELFAENVELDVLSATRPPGDLPWVSHGRWWTAHARLPLPAIVNPAAYAPVAGWNPGRSADFRERIFLLATIYCLLIGGITLWKSRWMPWAAVLASVFACGIFVLDDRFQSAITCQIGSIEVADPETLNDNWLFQISHRPTDFLVRIYGWARPIFADGSQPNSANLMLDCDAAGLPKTLTGHLDADQPLALLVRRFSIAYETGPVLNPVNSPISALAVPSVYPGCAVVGQIGQPSPAGAWPTVVMRR